MLARSPAVTDCSLRSRFAARDISSPTAARARSRALSDRAPTRAFTSAARDRRSAASSAAASFAAARLVSAASRASSASISTAVMRSTSDVREALHGLHQVLERVTVPVVAAAALVVRERGERDHEHLVGAARGARTLDEARRALRKWLYL